MYSISSGPHHDDERYGSWENRKSLATFHRSHHYLKGSEETPAGATGTGVHRTHLTGGHNVNYVVNMYIHISHAVVVVHRITTHSQRVSNLWQMQKFYYIFCQLIQWTLDSTWISCLTNHNQRIWNWASHWESRESSSSVLLIWTWQLQDSGSPSVRPWSHGIMAL